ncbi:MAG TPA: hypothetical protein VK436_16805 [Methanocella sp.]|nr:hypothetical protein [Methanocella sp.]
MDRDTKDLKQMFMQKKPCLIFLAISTVEKPYVSALMKEADTTFAHTTNILSDMEAFGLVEFISEGRVKYVRLTSRGREALKALKALDGVLGGGNQLKELKALETRVKRLEKRVRSDALDDKGVQRAIKSIEDISLRTSVIKNESQLYKNRKLDYEIKVMHERLDFLRDRVQQQRLRTE